MSGPIQRNPLGFLGFFDIKNLGVNPPQLADFIQPMIETRELYRAGQWVEQRAQIVLAGAAGLMQFNTFTDGTSAIVPPSEVWWVDDFTITAGVLAGDQLAFLPAIRGAPSGVAFTYQVGDWSLGDRTATQVAAGLLSASNRAPFLISPGGNFSAIVVDGNAAGGLTRTLTAHMRFVRMRI